MGGIAVGVTEAIILRAKLCGACRDGLPRVGQQIGDLTQSQLHWAEEHEIISARELVSEVGESEIPLSLLATDGDGYGYGDGYGSGSGYGYGYGDGDGYGYGYGYGSGYGSGDGDGYGDGSGWKVLAA